MTGLFTPELSDAPGEVFSLDADVSAAVVVVDPGFAMEDFVSDVRLVRIKNHRLGCPIRMIVLAGVVVVPGPLLLLLFDSSSSQSIQSSSGSESRPIQSSSRSRPSWSHPRSRSSDSSEALVDDFLADASAAAFAAIRLARFLINVWALTP